MKIIAVFLILGFLGFAFVASIFPFGRNTPLVDYVERQYGKSRVWLVIILVAVVTIAVRIVLEEIGVDNPFYDGTK